jgi:hypothetical protein
MNPVIEQRIREAARAEREQRGPVRFETQAGGAGRRFVAVYASPGYTRLSMHVIFTGGLSWEFEALAEGCKALFARLTAEA